MKVETKAIMILSMGYRKVTICQYPPMALTSAVNNGQKDNSNISEPAICPANVETRNVVKKPKIRILLLLACFMFLKAMDCTGEIRTMKPKI